MRINLFQTEPTLFNQVRTGTLIGAGSLHILGMEIPGSISFNTIAVIMSGSGAASENLSIYFGLYSLNASTVLSLANSASQATGLTLNQTAFSWITLATSATQDITPGNWYFAIMSSTSLGANFSFVNNFGKADITASAHSGFARGIMSVSTNAMPSSIATSDMIGEGGNSNAELAGRQYPYVLISA